jgi:4-amino-4-deoxy-L-arabinose transferase-like glycosyltransferase
LTRRNLVLLFGTMTALIAVVVPLAHNVHVLEYDEAIWMDVARNIQRLGLSFRSLGEQGQPVFEHTPLYLYMLSLYAQPSDSGILGARLVTLAFGLGCVWLTFAIGKSIRDSLAGFVAALLLAINAFFALYTFYIRMEVPMVFAMLAGLYLLLASDHGRRIGLVLAAGVSLAIAALFKEFAILFTGWCAVYVVLDCWRHRRVLVVAFVALIAPSVLAVALWANWAWRLAPIAFLATLQRWMHSIAGTNLYDPRVAVGARQWVQQLAFDLFGGALVIGLAISLVVVLRQRKGRPSPAQILLWGYLLSALVISFLVSLKELRNSIGVLPIAALIIGTSINWAGLIERLRASRRRLPQAAFAVTAIAFLLWASPLRVPTGPLGNVSSWLDTLYGRRLLENDRFYNVLRLTGRYLQEHTASDEVITVAHQAPVTAYYADRRHNMLYTLPKSAADRILERTKVLVWDDETFLAMTPAEVTALRNEVNARFKVVEVIRDGPRMVTILR